MYEQLGSALGTSWLNASPNHWKLVFWTQVTLIELMQSYHFC